jgi:hypothetical protein
MAALIKISNDPSIVIKPSDKGGSIVIMDKQNYIDECLRQLSNNKYYRELPEPIFNNNIIPLNSILTDLLNKKYIQKKKFEYLRAKEDCRPRVFYILPKVHKEKVAWPSPFMPPGRPIVSDCSSESYNISEYLDSFLTPLANKHPSYLKDTYDFLQKVTKIPIPPNSFLVTGDITSLYTNMDLNRTLATVRLMFSQNPDPSRPDSQLLELLSITLKQNDFTFNNKFYLQTCGIAMGKKYAPALANIFLINFDLVACKGYDGILPLLFFRFLDDIFFLWPGTIDQLLIFGNSLNKITPGIEVTLKFDPLCIDFLDTTIFKSTLLNSTVLHSRLFFKPTDTHQLLHTSSFHPPHTAAGVLKSQIIRFKRISTTFLDFENVCHILFNSLSKRGYSIRKFRSLRQEIWPAIPSPPPAPVAYSNGCNAKKCYTCPIIRNTHFFTSSVTKKHYPILTNCNCASVDIVYLITCKICLIQYVGETGDTLRNRMSHHRSNIKTNKNTPIGIHFNLLHRGQISFSVVPIEILNSNSVTDRRDRESHWQAQLQTFYPKGLNNYPVLDPHISFKPKPNPDPNPPKNHKPVKEFIPIVLPYNPLSVTLIKKWKETCLGDPNFSNLKFIAAFSKNNNLARSLVHSKL